MEKTIDYTLKDILADEQIRLYLNNCSPQIIRNCINNIEQKYFDGKKIYHVSSPKKKTDFFIPL